MNWNVLGGHRTGVNTIFQEYPRKLQIVIVIFNHVLVSSYCTFSTNRVAICSNHWGWKPPVPGTVHKPDDQDPFQDQQDFKAAETWMVHQRKHVSNLAMVFVARLHSWQSDWETYSMATWSFETYLDYQPVFSACMTYHSLLEVIHQVCGGVLRETREQRPTHQEPLLIVSSSIAITCDVWFQSLNT